MSVFKESAQVVKRGPEKAVAKMRSDAPNPKDLRLGGETTRPLNLKL